MNLDYKNAKEKLLTGYSDDCRQFFANSSYALENAYIHLLEDDIVGARDCFAAIKNSDIRAHWALLMISFIEGVVFEYPSYFELRNFLEIDLNILINYYKGDYVEKIIRYADFMYTINPEVYKFIGRVLYNNDLKEQGMCFLERAKSYFYHDPELHYLLAYVYHRENDLENAKKSLDNCLRILPEYFPAIDLKNKL